MFACQSRRNSSNDNHVDRISWIIDQRDHDNPQTSETKRTSPSLVARLCRTTSSPTRLPNTIPRSTTMETDGHPRTPMPICSWPSSGSPSRRNTITFNTTPSMCTHPQSLAAPMAAHRRTPSVVSTLCRMGGVIVPKPEGPPEPSLARIGLTPAQVHQAQVNLHSASSPLSQSGRSRVCRRRPPHRCADRINPDHRFWIG